MPVEEFCAHSPLGSVSVLFSQHTLAIISFCLSVRHSCNPSSPSMPSFLAKCGPCLSCCHLVVSWMSYCDEGRYKSYLLGQISIEKTKITPRSLYDAIITLLYLHQGTTFGVIVLRLFHGCCMCSHTRLKIEMCMSFYMYQFLLLGLM